MSLFLEAYAYFPTLDPSRVTGRRTWALLDSLKGDRYAIRLISYQGELNARPGLFFFFFFFFVFPDQRQARETSRGHVPANGHRA